MNRSPAFVTFTGIDARTDLQRAFLLQEKYHGRVEWGVLLSRSREGRDNRYPGGEALSNIMWSPLRRAGHVCGAHAHAIMGRQTVMTSVDFAYFTRVQVNHIDPDPAAILDFKRGWGSFRCIAQTRDLEFPSNTSVDWLFDRSSGTGARPDAWPKHPGGIRLVGYAGGIGPDNVAEIIRQIDCDGPYWIDMESGVRTDDWFDLDKVEAVLKAVYPER